MENENEVIYESESETSVTEETAVSDWPLKISRWALYAIFLMAPVFFLSYALPVWFGKQILVYLLAGAALVGWIANFLISGKIFYKKSLLNSAILLLLLVFFLSAVFSQSFRESILGADTTGEKFASFLVFAILFFIAGSVFSREDSVKVGLAFFGGVSLLALFSVFQMSGFHIFSGDYTSAFDFNPIGTANALAVFYGLALAAAIGVFSHFESVEEGRGRKLLWWVVLVAMALLFINLFLITNFKLVWLGLLVAMVVVLSLGVRSSRFSGEGEGSRMAGLKGLAFFLPLVVLVISALFYISFFQQNVMDSLTGGPQVQNRWSMRFPAEVSPNFDATIKIGQQVIKEKPWLGSGPATFIYDYSLFRNPDLNKDRIFWAVKFYHGSALASTLLATTGILGVAAFLLFVLVSLVVVLKSVLASYEPDAFNFGLAAAAVYGVIMWFIYQPTFSASLYLFLLLGVFAAFSGAEGGGRLAFGGRTIFVSSPSLMFIGSLLSIFLLVGTVVGMYYSFQKYLAESYYTEGVRLINQVGDRDKALVAFANANALDSRDDKYVRWQGQVYLLKLRDLVQKQIAKPNQNFINDFQNYFVSSFDRAREAKRLNPGETANWTLLGGLCETVIQIDPRICSEKFLTDTYEGAIQYDPIGPSVYADAGRAWILTADVLQLRFNQSKDAEEKKKLQEDYKKALENAMSFLEKSAALKPDFASSHFLQAQVNIRQNNLQGAIKKLEDAATAAVNDVGVWFQLGLLYYQAGQIDNAEFAFSQAVKFNDNYSNARYFLGLIYDRKGDKAGALDQFQRIVALNPDNQEVKSIIENLKANRSALSGVVPPETAPEKRPVPPVK